MSLHRWLLWLAVALIGSNVYADSSHCPCVPLESCSESSTHEPGKESSKCEDPATIRCCNGSSPAPNTESLEMISEELEEEQKFLEAIEDLMEKMRKVTVPGGSQREDKSFEGTSKNHIDCNGKPCEIINDNNNVQLPLLDELERPKESDYLSDVLKSESINENLTKITGDRKTINDTKMIIIVYPEKQKKNNSEKESPEIIYPSINGMADYLLGEDSSTLTKNNLKKDSREENESFKEDNIEYSKNQLGRGQANTQNLFQKMNPPMKSVEPQINADDLGEASSEIEEVKTTAPSSLQTEGTTSINHKPFRSLPKHLSPKIIDESTHSNVDLEPHRPSRGRTYLSKSTQNLMVNKAQHELSTADMMDEINLKAINDMMKTVYTTRPSFPRKQRPPWHPQSRIQKTSNSPANFTLQKAEEQKNMPHSTNPQDGELSLTDQSQNQTSQSVEHVTNTTAAEVQGSRYITRRRNQSRHQNSKLPTKISPTVSMTQEQVFDTLKESKPQESSRRRPSYRRSQVKTQSGTTAELAEQINSQSDPSFGRRRTKFQPRSRTNIMPKTPVKETNGPEILGNVKNTVSNSNDSNAVGSMHNTDNVHLIKSSEEVPSSNMDTQGDLEGSGSEIEFQRVRAPGRFTPPQRTEKGFQPMIGPTQLNVVGLVPAGFQDRARGFSNQEFELPISSLKPQFAREQFQFEPEEPTEKPLRLLPPVFPVPQPPTGVDPSSATTLIESYSDDDLLPPLQTPRPLSLTFVRNKPKATNDLNSSQQKDITELNLQFNELKTKYDMLLERYAATLKIYNEKYQDLIESVNSKK